MTSSVFSEQISDLLQTHFDQLHHGSGIAIEVIRERGYRSVMGKKELADLGFSPAQQRPPGILIPLYAPDGTLAGHQFRPDHPRLNQRGQPIKYELPAASAVRLDVPLRSRAAVADPSAALWFTEGAKKADAAASHGLHCVNLSGVWGFKGRNPFGGVTVLADFDAIALTGRECIIAYDSDIVEKRPVQQAMERLAEHLRRKGGTVYLARLPGGEGGAKVGLDDCLLTHSVEALWQLRHLLEDAEAGERNYDCRASGLGYLDADGEFHPIVPVPVSIAAIEQEAEGEAAEYTLAMQTKDGPRTLRLSAMDLADHRATKAAFLAHGIAIVPRREQFVSAALLATAGDYPKIHVYHRIGWSQRGYIAPGMEPVGVRVSLPQRVYVDMRGVQLAAARDAVTALLTAMHPEHMTVLLAHAFLAPLARPAHLDRFKYGVHITGRTGTLKTSVACCFMAFWAGADWLMHPVLKWGEGATNNAIMAHAAHLSDALILIDNFKPNTGGGSRDFIALLHNILEGADRERLTRQVKLRPTRELHAWPLTTGEDIPRQDAASLARLLVVRFTWPGGQNAVLAKCQAAAEHLPALMRRWIEYIASHQEWARSVGASLSDRRQRWAEWLLRMRPGTVNATRLATNLALQEIAWEAMGECPDLSHLVAQHSGAHQRGLHEVALEMGAETAGSLEANIWLAALSDVLGSGRVYLRSLDGVMPDLEPSKTARAIGWQDEDCYYLLPTVAQEEVLEALRRSGQPLAVGIQTLYRQLAEVGVLLKPSNSERYTPLRKIGGQPRRILQLRRSSLEAAYDSGEGEPEIDETTV